MPDTKIALVTGANKGIGLQIAKDLAAHQFTVLLGSRDLQRGHAAAQTIDGTAQAVQLDVTDPASITAAAQRITSDYGHLDVLVNNAGISHTDISDEAPSDASLQQIVQAGRMSVAPPRRGPRDLRRQRLRRHRRHPGDAPAPTPSTRSSHRQRRQQRRVADPQLRPEQPPPRHVRDLLSLQNRAQRAHGRVRRRSRSRRHQGELGLPRLHRHRPQLLSRRPHRRAGRT